MLRNTEMTKGLLLGDCPLATCPAVCHSLRPVALLLALGQCGFQLLMPLIFTALSLSAAETMTMLNHCCVKLLTLIRCTSIGLHFRVSLKEVSPRYAISELLRQCGTPMLL